jgi:hypothetical protein
MAAGNNVKVVCRFRPQSKRENEEGGVVIVSFSEDGTTVTLNVSKQCATTRKLRITLLGK